MLPVHHVNALATLVHHVNVEPTNKDNQQSLDIKISLLDHKDSLLKLVSLTFIDILKQYDASKI